MAFNNVCRLCMSDKELVWVFDQRFGESEKKMKNVVMITTGVEILEKDLVSQNICTSCCKLTIKMFDYRERAIKTDQYLKNHCKEILTGSEITFKIPNTNISITKETMDLVQTKPKPKKFKESTGLFNKNNSNEVQKKPKRNIHPSIQEIFSIYADIKIPTGCLKFNVNPVIFLQMNCIEEYFRHNTVDKPKHVHLASKKDHENTRFEDRFNTINNKLTDVTHHVNKRKLVDINDYNTNKTLMAKKIKLSSIETFELKRKENINVSRIKKHFICSYCKNKFRLFERKEKHEKTCALTFQAYVKLERMDFKKNTINIHKKETEIIELSDDENNILLPAQDCIIEPTQYISTAVVKPCIEINNNNVLNTINTSNTDLNILKELLTQTGIFNIKLTVDAETQTTLLPSNDQIILNRLNRTAVIKNIVPHLYAFKVPINIKHGDFNITYTKNNQQVKKRVIDHWRYLEPEDIIGNISINLNKRLSQGISLFDNTQTYSLTENNLSPINNNLTKQVLTSKIFLPNVVQVSHIHNLPQQVQTHQISNLSNLTSNINTYFVQSNGNSQIVNTTNSNMQGFVNINTTNLSLTFSNSTSVIKTIPLTIQSSISKTPSTNSGSNVNNSSGQSVNKPQIRVKNIFDLK